MIGKKISHYKITAELGAGGMGQVYLATDTKLDRKVALKFLPPHLSPVGDIRARFIQEAKAASALNHPNVCTIHDIQDHDGQMFIVMEYVEGQTLRARIGNLSLKQVTEFGAQIADGLAAAHEKGIVHRDIKSENIMVRKDGIVLIMDFGLAKLHGVSRLTKEGSTLGTAGYMAPEQVQGQDVDHRADIFSLGIVLYEMLTGELPFKGTHEAAIAYEIVNVDAAPPSALNPEIDPELDRIVLECLDKEPDERYQSARELAKDLKRHRRDSGRKRVSRVSTIRPSAYTVPPAESAPTAAPAVSKPRSSVLPWTVAALSVVCAVAIGAWHFGSPAPEQPVRRSHLLAPDGKAFRNFGGGHLALSPNGEKVAFVAVDSSTGHTSLWVRPLNSLVALELPNTNDAMFPFWSPDSRYIAYFDNDHLRKIQATGGPPLTICDAPAGRGGSWNKDNVIIFAPVYQQSAINRVAAAGGDPEPVTTLDSAFHDHTHRWPVFLPDGVHFLYFARTETGSGGEADAICLGSLDGSIGQRLIRTKSNIEFAAGHILYLRDGTLMVQAFDEGSLTFSADAYPIAEHVSFDQGWSRGIFTASQNGLLAYQSGAIIAGSQLTIYDRHGELLDTIGSWERQYAPQFSPDGSRVAVDITDQSTGTVDIWIHELARGIRTRLTFDAADDYTPVWSPDGLRIAFASERGGKSAAYVKNADGVGETKLLMEVESGEELYLQSWSSDGQYIACVLSRAKGDDVEIIEVASGKFVASLADTLFNEDWPAISPDGRWLAYESDETGKEQIYVALLANPGAKWQVSTNEGDRPVWRADGKELFFLDNTDRLMVAQVDGDGASFKVGKVTPLFSLRASRPGTIYDVSNDGQRFLVNTRSSSGSISAITLVSNWDKELQEQ